MNNKIMGSDLNNKVIIVTGGTQGLGEGIARHLSSIGVKGLAICGRNQEKGDKVAEELSKNGTPTLFVRADLSREDECRSLVKECYKKYKRIDGLVNAAGDTSRGGIEDTTVELWDYLFAVNARAPFILMQETIKIMRREKIKGSIVNIISISSYGGQPFITAYCASKGALAVLTKNIANSVKYDRIRVNGINIGWTYTDNEDQLQKRLGKPDNWLEAAEAETPFKRILRPVDAAKLTSYLLSDDSEMMTGSIIDFDQQVLGTFDDKG
jgi:NAD(P)-dependent dehydrogenase (short-subunit alcohol dehydrogenase family)